ASARSPLTAIRLVLASTPVNVYCIVTAMLLGIGAITNGGLVLQGRYWLPVVTALGVVVFVQLPKFLRPGVRRRARAAIVTFAATYAVVASICGLRALQSDYYDAAKWTPTSDSIADIDRVSVNGGERSDVDALTIRKGQSLRLSGYAVDMMTGMPAQVVILSIDGRDRAELQRLRPDQHVASVFNDDLILRSGFDFDIARGTEERGTHVVRCYVVDRKATYRLAIRRTILLRVI
ncbi:MAG: hypothetical protein IAI49_11895, partial [Candidatus Eremiobacteraeota bacterium]|nr:hypothetical protein [Candidatus Eremiobacteraeota bacterium]